MSIDLQTRRQRAVVVAVQLPRVSELELTSSLNELRELAKTLGYEVVGSLIQKRASFDIAGYLGVGKRQELRHFVESGVPLTSPDVDSDATETVHRAARSGRGALQSPKEFPVIVSVGAV